MPDTGEAPPAEAVQLTGDLHVGLFEARVRRPFWFGVVFSVLLHFALLFGGLRWPVPDRALTELTVTLPPPRPPAGTPAVPAPPQKPARPKRLSRPAAEAQSPPPPVETPPVMTPPEADAAVPAPADPTATAPADLAPPADPGVAAAAATPQAAPAEPLPPAATAGVTAPSAGNLLGSLPREGEVDYQVTKGESDWRAGRGTLRWKIEGDRYHLELEARAEGLPGLIYWNPVRWTSDGHLTAGGMQPDIFMKSDVDGVRFDWVAQTATFLPSNFVRPLPPGLLDLLSVFFQFALRAPTDDELAFPVTNGDKIDQYRFERTERTSLKLAMGEIGTLHISREHQVKENGFEIWLAPDRNFLPVQLRIYHARYGVLNLYATGIRVNGPPSRLQEP